jgi:hypothetical protein
MKLNYEKVFYLIKMFTFFSIILRISYFKFQIKKKNADFQDKFTKLNINLNLNI